MAKFCACISFLINARYGPALAYRCFQSRRRCYRSAISLALTAAQPSFRRAVAMGLLDDETITSHVRSDKHYHYAPDRGAINEEERGSNFFAVREGNRVMWRYGCRRSREEYFIYLKILITIVELVKKSNKPSQSNVRSILNSKITFV